MSPWQTQAPLLLPESNERECGGGFVWMFISLSIRLFVYLSITVIAEGIKDAVCRAFVHCEGLENMLQLDTSTEKVDFFVQLLC